MEPVPTVGFQHAGGQMAPSGRVTIADVAAASGVGVGTVSRVINGGANVRESTRRSVLTVIRQLGYRPSYLAASLSRGTPRTIAIVVPHLTAPSVVMRLAGPLTVLDEQCYDVAGGRIATEHLLSLGHRRIGFIGDTRHLATGTGLGFTASHQRLRGYQQALRNA